MSHIAKVETEIQDKACLKRALENLGMRYEEARVGESLSVRGYGKGEEIVGCELKIDTGCSYGIGVREREGKYEFEADWWAVETFSGERAEDVLGKIKRRYAYERVMEKARELGYAVAEEREEADGRVRLTVRRWA